MWPGLQSTHITNHNSSIPLASDWVEKGHVTHFQPMEHSGKSSETPLRKEFSFLFRKKHERERVLPSDIAASGCDSWDCHGHVTIGPEESQPMDGRVEMEKVPHP